MEILLIFVLILFNGFLALAEIAVVSSRKSKLEVASQKGNKAAQEVLKLVDNPSQFLSTIQIGLTIISILTGVFSSDAFADSLAIHLSKIEFLRPFARQLAVVIVIIPVSFMSIFLGELLPKRIGLTNPEGFAMAFVKPVAILSKVAYPFIWLLEKAIEGVIKIIRVKAVSDSAVLEEEIKSLVEEGTNLGSIQEIEQDLVENVFHVGDRKINSLMTHSSDVVWLDMSHTVPQIHETLLRAPHLIYPVRDAKTSAILGVLNSKDFLLHCAMKGASSMDMTLIREAHYFHETMSAYKVLEKFRTSHVHFGFVVDEYGSLMGIVTINDIIDALIGNIVDEDSRASIVTREDGSWLVDARISFADFCKYFDLNISFIDTKGFATLGGLMLELFKHIPQTGEIVSWRDFSFEIVDMDGTRIDKILVYKQAH